MKTREELITIRKVLNLLLEDIKNIRDHNKPSLKFFGFISKGDPYEYTCAVQLIETTRNEISLINWIIQDCPPFNYKDYALKGRVQVVNEKLNKMGLYSFTKDKSGSKK